MGAHDNHDCHEQIEANDETGEVDVDGELEIVEEFCHIITRGG